MECIHCGAELEYHDYYYTRGGGKQGDIYKCPNCDGFSSVGDAMEHIDLCEDELDDYLRANYMEGWEEIQCESNCNNGFYYIDKQGNLHEGYPC